MTDTEKFKKKLEEEKRLLEQELKSLGHKNPNNTSDWVPDPEKDTSAPFERADTNLAADRLEDYEGRVTVTETLEERLLNVNEALSRIEEKTYGVCRVGGEKIEEERLEANPAATTCKEHINE